VNPLVAAFVAGLGLGH